MLHTQSNSKNIDIKNFQVQSWDNLMLDVILT